MASSMTFCLERMRKIVNKLVTCMNSCLPS